MAIKMLIKFFVVASFFALTGCGGGGNGSNGLNGSIALTTTVSGKFINATATYTNPTRTDLIGMPISFSYDDGNGTVDLGTFSTNNSGSVGLTFMPKPFVGSKDIVVQAKTGNLTDFKIVTMSGATFSMTPPTAAAPITADATVPLGSTASFALTAANFVQIVDPFLGDIANHPILVNATFTSSPDTNNTLDSLTPATTTITTTAAGVASLAGVTMTVAVPNTVSSRTVTITWVATDLLVGFQATGTTNLTVTRTAVP
ncbi:hypothetical protein [Geobacter sp. AOG1]|uniref:hypothetical protein n=1 Tax=Geobacter sp. AOG1 TaxID=1566346 RepID=UPI001CC35BE7|nr:hypothetical protein [Geobacter sp. AOG1]GFE58282.1 hypothetical protein AOG1_21620 [Geobacter sp. AOG1]